MERIERFNDYQRAGGLAPRTLKRRETTLRLFSRLIGDLATASTDDVIRFLGHYSSPKTKHAYRSDLMAFYKWAVNRGLVVRNPVDGTAPVKLTKPLPRPLTPDQVRVALAFGPKRTRRMVALGAFAGLRCAEIASLDGSDLFFHVNPPVLHVRNGKGGKDRVVPMHPELVEIMHGVAPAGPVFPGLDRQGPVAAASVSALLSRHLKRCGIEATPHQLRHSFGTEMLRSSKGNILKVADAMGHGSIETTRGYIGWSGTSYEDIKGMYGGDAA